MLYPCLYQRLLLWSEKNGCPFTLPVDRTVRPRWKRLPDVPDRRQRRKIFNAFHGRLGNRRGEAASTLVSVSVFRDLRWKPAHPRQKRKNLYTCTKNLLSMAVPLTSNRIVLNLFAGFENVMLPNRLLAFGYTQSEALSVYGILTGMAMSVIMFPSVITNSVSVLLLPTISEAQAAGKRDKILYTIKKTIESCLLLGFLSTAGFLVTGNFLGNFLFNNALAGTFIATLGWLCPFLYLSSTLSSILHGLGHPWHTFE